jgi:hypothetical protein
VRLVTCLLLLLLLPLLRQFNIRVVVKSTGHEFQGRSTAAGALLVWLRGMKGISVSLTPTPTVTSSPGDMWADVYDFVRPYNYGVVGGSCR